ncbi:hypothetical protein HDU82_002668 [Entophlyctis luteolus]|nr:hypothetical protein HDU82_002668 [Entophlyctis luteolus]
MKVTTLIVPFTSISPATCVFAPDEWPGFTKDILFVFLLIVVEGGPALLLDVCLAWAFWDYVSVIQNQVEEADKLLLLIAKFGLVDIFLEVFTVMFGTVSFTVKAVHGPVCGTGLWPTVYFVSLILRDFLLLVIILSFVLLKSTILARNIRDREKYTQSDQQHITMPQNSKSPTQYSKSCRTSTVA